MLFMWLTINSFLFSVESYWSRVRFVSYKLIFYISCIKSVPVTLSHFHYCSCCFIIRDPLTTNTYRRNVRYLIDLWRTFLHTLSKYFFILKGLLDITASHLLHFALKRYLEILVLDLRMRPTLNGFLFIIHSFLAIYSKINRPALMKIYLIPRGVQWKALYAS